MPKQVTTAKRAPTTKRVVRQAVKNGNVRSSVIKEAVRAVNENRPKKK